MDTPIRDFITHHYRHFNSATLVDAAKGYEDHLASGKKMLISLAGAMSTAELGISLAEMIRQDKVHMISCTGANLEEDLFNLVAKSSYEKIKDWRSWTAEEDKELQKRGISSFRNSLSSTIIFERPNEEFVLKWQLACTGNIAHVVVMPSVDKNKIDLSVLMLENLLESSKSAATPVALSTAPL